MCIRDRVHTVTADRYMGAGTHSFRVEYFEVGGQAVARFSRQQISGAPNTFNNWRGEYFNNMEFCLLYTSDAADERSSVDLGGRRIIKKKKDT